MPKLRVYKVRGLEPPAFRIRVYKVTGTGTAVPPTPKLRVYDASGVGDLGAKFAVDPSPITVEPQDRVFLSVTPADDSVSPDTYTWRVVTGAVTIDGSGSTVSFVAPSVMPPTVQIKIGVKASLGSSTTTEAFFIVPILPQTTWRLGPAGVWTGAKPRPVVPPPPAGSNLKQTGGLVVVDPSKLAGVAPQGVNHIALKVPWSSVEPSRGVYNWGAIDNALSTYSNASFTLRIQSGQYVPSWLIAVTGAVTVLNAARGITVNVCHWWEAQPMDAWRSMIAAAGKRYDAHPRISMVSADQPMVVYSEPFILGSDKQSGIRLYNAGCNQNSHAAAITRCVNDTAAAFPTTHVELAIHSDMQAATATGVVTSWPNGRILALSLATTHGKHLVFSDYGLDQNDTAAAHTPTGTITTETDVYAWMKLRSAGGAAAWAGPTTYQLTVGKSPQTQETYRQAAQNAIDLGGSQCETAGWGLLGSLAGGLDQALKANAALGV